MENECGRRRKKKLSRKYNNEQTNDDNRCFATSVCHSSMVVKVSSVCIIWWRGSGQRVQSIHQVSKLALDVADRIDSQYSELLRQQ